MTNHTVQYHTINQLLNVVGEEGQEKAFHTFYRKDTPQRIPILYPFRTDYYIFLFMLEGELCLKLNLLDYVIKKNNLLIMEPNVVRQFQQVSEDCRFIGIGFTPSFLSATGIHKNDLEVFEVLSSRQNPLFQLEPLEAEAMLHQFMFLHLKREEAINHHYLETMLMHSFSALLYEVAYLFRVDRRVNEIKLTRKEELTIQFLKLLPLHFKEELITKVKSFCYLCYGKSRIT